MKQVYTMMHSQKRTNPGINLPTLPVQVMNE